MKYGEPNRIQWELLLYSLGAGFLLGLCYAMLMLLRAAVRHSAAAVAVEDVLFCVASAFFTFLFLLDYNSGVVRFYLIAAESAGFLAVRTAVGKIIRKIQKNACKKGKG